jgi:hypothetical protein
LNVRAQVLGMGLWMPGFPDVTSWLTGRAVEGADAPNAQSKQRRRSSLLVNMVADVAAQASAQSGVPLSRLRVVVGSAFGELSTLVDMLDERERDGLLSPLRFQNSVHNSAAGQLSIAHKNKTPAMSLAAGNDTVAMVLLEALTLLALGGDEVLAVVADEPLPASIRPGRVTTAVAAALVLGAETTAGADARPPIAVIEDLRQAQATPPAADRPQEVDDPCASILRLFAALAQAHGGRVSISPPEDPRWSIAVRDARDARAGGAVRSA